MSKSTSSSTRGQIDPHVDSYTKKNEHKWIYEWGVEVIESTNPELLVIYGCCGTIGGCKNPSACADQYETLGVELEKMPEPAN